MGASRCEQVISANHDSASCRFIPDLEQTTLGTELSESPIRPYGEILDGILSGDPLLSVRGDIAEECWRILTPVLDSWASGEVPLDEYTAGSYGPTAWN